MSILLYACVSVHILICVYICDLCIHLYRYICVSIYTHRSVYGLPVIKMDPNNERDRESFTDMIRSHLYL